MNNSEKFCLKWNDFSENLTSTFSDLRNDEHLVDVTLACEDGTQIEAHKIVLTAGSHFFKSLLKTKRKDTPIIYMRGLKGSELSAIVDFLYHGEANIQQDELNNFLSLAEELELRGLEGGKEKSTKCDKIATRNHNNDETKPNVTGESLDISGIAKLPIQEFSQDIISEDIYGHSKQVVQMDPNDDLDQKMSELIQRTGETWACTVCGKQAANKNNLKKHTQLHIQGLSYPCTYCGKDFRCKNNLTTHIYRAHKTV